MFHIYVTFAICNCLASSMQIVSIFSDRFSYSSVKAFSALTLLAGNRKNVWPVKIAASGMADNVSGWDVLSFWYKSSSRYAAVCVASVAVHCTLCGTSPAYFKKACEEILDCPMRTLKARMTESENQKSLKLCTCVYMCDFIFFPPDFDILCSSHVFIFLILAR